LRELYLKLAFPRARVLRKDVQDDLSAVEYLQIGQRRDVA
jgi:hypothetical protein